MFLGCWNGIRNLQHILCDWMFPDDLEQIPVDFYRFFRHLVLLPGRIGRHFQTFLNPTHYIFFFFVSVFFFRAINKFKIAVHDVHLSSNDRIVPVSAIVSEFTRLMSRDRMELASHFLCKCPIECALASGDESVGIAIGNI